MSNNRYNIPVSEDVREWLEDSMGWLHSNFKEEFFSKPVLTPNSPLFSFRFTGDFSDADKVLQILLEVMDISAEDVELNFYADGQKQVGGNGGMFMLPGTGQKFTGGLYHGKGRDGKYHISLNVDSVKIPNRLIAVLAHELAHVKLLGERRLKINNEHLTDLLTIVFGFGIFNSTEAFTYSRNAESWSYSRAGYLSQMEWGYALALHAWLRKEENPDWLQFIPIDVENDFKKSMRFILDNESLIMATEFIGDEIPAHPEAEKTEPIDYDKEKEILQNAESMYKLATEDPAAAAKAIYEQFKNGETDAYILELGLYCNMDTQQFLKADEIATYIENSNNLDERQLCNIAILKLH